MKTLQNRFWHPHNCPAALLEYLSLNLPGLTFLAGLVVINIPRATTNGGQLRGFLICDWIANVPLYFSQHVTVLVFQNFNIFIFQYQLDLIIKTFPNNFWYPSQLMLESAQLESNVICRPGLIYNLSERIIWKVSVCVPQSMRAGAARNNQNN